MSKKLFDFLSSFGMMLAGVGLLFFSTLFFTKISHPTAQSVLYFPKSNPRAQLGGDLPAQTVPVSRPRVPLKKDEVEYDVPSTAEAIFAVDDQTGTVLYLKNADALRPIASITKLVSAAVILDLNIVWTTTTEIMEEDIDSDTKYLKIGEVFSAEDLWHITLIGSSNSAVNALVRLTGLSTDDFAKKMNEKCKEWNLKIAHFVEPTGLDARDVASAKDVVNILKNVLQIEKIKDTLAIDEYYANPKGQKPRRVWTTDLLLSNWIKNDFKDGAVIGKTGYIIASKYNFVVRIEDGKKRAVRIAVLGADTNDARFIEARDIANWIFAHYLWPQDEGYGQLTQ